jgi:hypothetical protein
VFFRLSDKVHSEIEENGVTGMNSHDSLFGLEVIIGLLPVGEPEDKNKELAFSLMVLEFIISGEFIEQLLLLLTVLLLHLVDGGDVAIRLVKGTDVGEEDLLSLAFGKVHECFDEVCGEALFVFEAFGVDVFGEGVLQEIEVDFDFEGDF